MKAFLVTVNPSSYKESESDPLDLSPFNRVQANTSTTTTIFNQKLQIIPLKTIDEEQVGKFKNCGDIRFPSKFPMVSKAGEGTTILRIKESVLEMYMECQNEVSKDLENPNPDTVIDLTMSDESSNHLDPNNAKSPITESLLKKSKTYLSKSDDLKEASKDLGNNKSINGVIDLTISDESSDFLEDREFSKSTISESLLKKSETNLSKNDTLKKTSTDHGKSKSRNAVIDLTKNDESCNLLKDREIAKSSGTKSLLKKSRTKLPKDNDSKTTSKDGKDKYLKTVIDLTISDENTDFLEHKKVNVPIEEPSSTSSKTNLATSDDLKEASEDIRKNEFLRLLNLVDIHEAESTRRKRIENSSIIVTRSKHVPSERKRYNKLSSHVDRFQDKLRVSSNNSNDSGINEGTEVNAKNMVTIGKNNTKIGLDVYNSLNFKSYTATTRKLLITLFDREVLASSSLTGKCSPAFLDRDVLAKPQLNEDIVSDIVDFVTTKAFNIAQNGKSKVTKSQVRQAITLKLADENKLLKKRLSKDNSRKSTGDGRSPTRGPGSKKRKRKSC